MSWVQALISLGSFGLLGLSVLWPLLALPVYFFQRVNRNKGPLPSVDSPCPPASIDVLIPAHNEEAQIGATLASLRNSIARLEAAPTILPPPSISVHVGANGCTDKTPQLARQFPGVYVKEIMDLGSKWSTLRALVAESSAEWVIFMDVGTVWPEGFLSNFVQLAARTRNAIAIAPSYRPLNAGWLPRIIWRLEMLLKKLETFSGGPVSLHGATVGYKTAPLKQSLAHLGDTPWLNDDVVIPLMLRALHPEGAILYPMGQVQDAGVRNERLDVGRRKRMLRGNLQWAVALLPVCFRLNPVAGLVAFRRLFRVFWAWWLAFLLVGTATAYHVVVPVILAAGILMLLFGSFRQLAGAALVSLLAPLHLGALKGVGGVAWE